MVCVSRQTPGPLLLMSIKVDRSGTRRFANPQTVIRTAEKDVPIPDSSTLSFCKKARGHEATGAHLTSINGSSLKILQAWEDSTTEHYSAPAKESA
ncbi:hypothetical protein MAJ_09429, partial [Metarhizium majus ARSEF 297]